MRRAHYTSYALIATTVTVVIGCSSSAEKNVIDDFFRASRLRDNVTLGNFATATFDPRTDGVVQSFDVVTVSEDRVFPLPLKQYAKSLDDAKAAEQAFSTDRRAYWNANITAIDRVTKAQAAGKPIAAKDQAIKTAWDKWMADGTVHTKAVSDARKQLGNSRALAELSLARSGHEQIDVTKYDGQLIAKDVTVNATVRTPDGKTVTKPLKVGLRRAKVKDAKGSEKTGRWIVTSIASAS